MRYTFQCKCGPQVAIRSISEGPPEPWTCEGCGQTVQRDWQADAPMLDTSKCRDANEVKAPFRTRSHWDGNKSGDQVEHEFQQHVKQRRKEIRDAGGQSGVMRQTHSVPTHVYHGKIRETGDKNYWDDPSNLARHKECRVDD